jgi:hypothetical protein
LVAISPDAVYESKTTEGQTWLADAERALVGLLGSGKECDITWRKLRDSYVILVVLQRKTGDEEG